MNIALCIDDNFIMQASTLLASIQCTNANESFDVYVVSEGLKEDSKQKLLEREKDSNIHIHFMDISLSDLPELPLEGKEHISLATYYRLLMPFVVPKELGRILYLDCDMLVLDNLRPLYDTELASVCCAATIDMFNDDKEIPARLAYRAEAGYFNAGMLLINLAEWHKNKISQKALEFIASHPERCLAHDQDALNHALDGNYKKVSARYNMQLDFFCDFSNLIVDQKYFSDIEESQKNPCIVHFTGPTKPWLKNCVHPYTKLWDFFQSKTQWRGLKKKYEYKGFKLFKYFIKIILLRINIKFVEKKPFLSSSYRQALCILNKLKNDGVAKCQE